MTRREELRFMFRQRGWLSAAETAEALDALDAAERRAAEAEAALLEYGTILAKYESLCDANSGNVLDNAKVREAMAVYETLKAGRLRIEAAALALARATKEGGQGS